MTKGISFKVHPFFLCMILSFFLTERSILFWNALFCWGIQEGCCLLFALRRGGKLRHIRLTPLGIRAEVHGQGWEIGQYFVGSLAGVILSIIFFGAEMKGAAGISLFLSAFRLLPILPLDGGRLFVTVLGHRYGHLWAARFLTKVGQGMGYGCMIFGFLVAVLYPYHWVIFLWGTYLVYANGHEFLHIAKKFYERILSSGEKPLRGVSVTGEESVLNLVMKLNTQEETFFFRGETEGVSQERVLLAFFSGRNTSWLWQVADRKKSCKIL